MTRKLGNINAGRFSDNSIPNWRGVPLLTTPGDMASYGIFEEFLGEGADVVANSVVPLASGTWYLTLANACTLSQADATGGHLTLTTAATAEDGAQVALGGVQAGGGVFWPAAGKTIWFEARLKFTDLGGDKLNGYCGLVNPTATEWLPDGGGGGMAAGATSEYIGWVLQDTETNWSFVGKKAAAEDYNDCGAGCDTTDAAYHYMGFRVNGVTSVYAYWDRVQIAAAQLATANIPVTGLMPGFAIKTGDTNVNTLTIDYIQCVQLR